MSIYNACTKNQDNIIIFDIIKLSYAPTSNITRNHHTHIIFARIYWLYSSTAVSSTNKTGRHDIAEILMKVTPNTMTQ